MAEIFVHSYLSPRIVEVLDPETEITVQEIVDILRDWEDDEANQSRDPLIDAAGKEPLGGGVTVGITATLQNAQLRFTARVTPLENGTVTTADSTGKVLIDSAATFQTNGIYKGCTVLNTISGAMETVNDISSEIQLSTFVLLGGTRQDWQVGDVYLVYPNVQCSITGGNLVAVDENGAEISPILQSPNVQVKLASSSSATLQELGAVQYSSFNGGVTVDPVNGTSATVFPAGTPQQPVDNLQDAMTIAITRGLTTIFFIGDAVIDSGYDYQGMTFIGESIDKSVLTISDAAQVDSCEFYEATVEGILDGNALVQECRILDLEYINGVVKECLLGPGTIILGGGAEAYLLDCWSGDAAGAPVIDCGGSGQELNLQRYSGDISIKNKTGPESIVVNLDVGEVEIQATVTAGPITIRGTGSYTNLSALTSPADIDDAALINKRQISNAVWDEDVSDHIVSGSSGEAMRNLAFRNTVIVCSVHGSPGTDFPHGTSYHPVDNMSDARTIADNANIQSFRVQNEQTLDQSYIAKRFVAETALTTDKIHLNGQDISGSFFERLTIEGTMVGAGALFYESQLISPSGVSGILVNSAVQGTLTMGGPGSVVLCTRTNMVTDPTIVDMVGTGRVFQGDISGDIKICNMVAGSYISIGMGYGTVELDSNCTGGTIVLSGSAILTDNSAGSTVINNLESTHDIATAVWDEAVASHIVAGSSGEALRNMAFDGTIYIDALGGGTSGTTFPTGTNYQPVDNFIDAMSIAATTGIRVFNVKGQIVVTQDTEGYRFIGAGDVYSSMIVLPGGVSVNSSVFDSITVTGAATGSANFEESVLINVSGINVALLNSGVIGVLGIPDGATIIGQQVSLVPDMVVFDFGGFVSNVKLEMGGAATVINMVAGDEMTCLRSGGPLIIDASCTGGTIVDYGSGSITDLSGGAVTVLNSSLEGLHGDGSWEGAGAAGDIADAVWDEARADHTDAGSFGAVAEWSGAGLDPDDIAAAVWNAVATTYGTPGTMGWLQNLIDSGIISIPKILPGD